MTLAAPPTLSEYVDVWMLRLCNSLMIPSSLPNTLAVVFLTKVYDGEVGMWDGGLQGTRWWRSFFLVEFGGANAGLRPSDVVSIRQLRRQRIGGCG